jgi:hypothetical protein
MSHAETGGVDEIIEMRAEEYMAGAMGRPNGSRDRETKRLSSEVREGN